MNDTSIHQAIGEYRFDDFLAIVNDKNMDWRDERGYTPLHFAVLTDQVEIVKRLIELGVDLDAKSYKNEDTAIMFACKYGWFDIAEALAVGGADVKLVNLANKTAADYAKDFIQRFVEEHLTTTHELNSPITFV